MKQDVTPELKLDNIQEHVKLSNGRAKQLMETCIWCLLYCNHTNGVNIKVKYEDNTSNYSVIWPLEKVDIEAIKRSYNKDDAIEDGAEAIALLVSVERTNFTAVERAITTTGIDYWLGFKDRHPNYPFHKASRLEISGIMKETLNNSVSRRVREKLCQTRPTDNTSFPVYVIIVEFSQPQAIMVFKNVNS